MTVDASFPAQIIKRMAVEKLEGKLPGVFSMKNVMMSITHSHSAPGGTETGMPGIFGLGVVRASVNAVVDGVFRAILQAHNNTEPAATKLTIGSLEGASINRSPTAYLKNPESERKNYSLDYDERFLQLNIVSESTGNLTGLLNWFAVHPNSLDVTNKLVSGDNKGYAAYDVERHFNGIDKPPGMGPFVAGFASSNLGDLSPQTKGAKCQRGPGEGQPCSNRSTCPSKWSTKFLPLGDPTLCWGLGPESDSGTCYGSNRVIGTMQSDKAIELTNATSQTQLTGKIDFRHSYVLFPEVEVPNPESEESKSKPKKIKLCWPAMGMSFAAGSSDGTGTKIFTYTQGAHSPISFNPVFQSVIQPFITHGIGKIVSQPTWEDKACQGVKPILGQFGSKKGGKQKPIQMYPAIVPVQIFRVGCFFILSCAAEPTTMAGRRIRKQVKQVIIENLPEGECDEVHVTIAGLANSYSGYITTREEYQLQRFVRGFGVGDDYGRWQVGALGCIVLFFVRFLMCTLLVAWSVAC